MACLTFSWIVNFTFLTQRLSLAHLSSVAGCPLWQVMRSACSGPQLRSPSIHTRRQMFTCSSFIISLLALKMSLVLAQASLRPKLFLALFSLFVVHLALSFLTVFFFYCGLCFGLVSRGRAFWPQNRNRRRWSWDCVVVTDVQQHLFVAVFDVKEV